MTEEEYKAAIEKYKAEHSAGGSLEHGEWKNHKYIRIENGRYIYPDDLKKTASNNAKNKISETLNAFKSAGQNISQAVKDHKAEAEAKKAAADVMKAGRIATQQYKESGQYEKDIADEKAKRETMARQEEAKKITSLTPDEARKRAAELTKQNTPEKKAEAPTKESVKKEMVEYFKANGGTFKEGDNALTFKDKLESVGLNQKDLSDMLSEAKNTTTQAPVTNAVDKYKPISPDKMSKEQLDAFKEMSKEYMEGMEYSAEVFKRDNKKPTKVVVTKYDPYTGAPVAAKVTYIDNNGHEQDTGYFFKDLLQDATPDNLQRRIDNNKREKQVQHSYTDPKSFYAAVYDYKKAHKR